MSEGAQADEFLSRKALMGALDRQLVSGILQTQGSLSIPELEDELGHIVEDIQETVRQLICLGQVNITSDHSVQLNTQV